MKNKEQIDCRKLREDYYVESELIQFRYNDRENYIDLTVNYAAENAGKYFEHLQSGGSQETFRVQDLEFRWLRFVDIAQFTWPNNRWFSLPEDFNLHESGSSKLLETAFSHIKRRFIIGVDCFRTEANDFSMWLDFDTLGEFSWRHKSMFLSCRRVRFFEDDDQETRYVDTEDGALIDIENPFDWKNL
ncbi:MAG: hypothetical protein KDA65_03265 [Planctomycetaceae bacterium]|nr:hypothetical protein [Planctomycetaceae bacterium]